MDQVSCRVTITPWSLTTHLEARIPVLSPFKPELPSLLSKSVYLHKIPLSRHLMGGSGLMGMILH